MSVMSLPFQENSQAGLEETLLEHLLRPQAAVSPKYLYDALGSRLFEAITELPEYSPTREEREILTSQLPLIATQLSAAAALIDLGAGSCRKAASLIPTLKPAHYLAIDISEDFLRESLARLGREFPGLPISGLATDFSGGLPAGSVSNLLPPGMPRIFFYPGSSIGNFHPPDATRFLSGLRVEHQADTLLIGVDLIKDVACLEAAYDDSLGVTAAFNKNILLHLNRLLCTDFYLRDWSHKAFFNAEKFRIEMHLEVHDRVVVRWPGGERVFEPGETIHTENSYKYSVKSFQTLLTEAGYAVSGVFQGLNQGFAVFTAYASKA